MMLLRWPFFSSGSTGRMCGKPSVRHVCMYRREGSYRQSVAFSPNASLRSGQECGITISHTWIFPCQAIPTCGGRPCENVGANEEHDRIQTGPCG